MDKFSELVTSSVLARALALFILFLALVGAILIAVDDYLRGIAPPAEIINFIYVGLGGALIVAGINIGIVLQPLITKKEAPGNGSTSATTNP